MLPAIAVTGDRLRAELTPSDAHNAFRTADSSINLTQTITRECEKMRATAAAAKASPFFAIKFIAYKTRPIRVKAFFALFFGEFP